MKSLSQSRNGDFCVFKAHMRNKNESIKRRNAADTEGFSLSISLILNEEELHDKFSAQNKPHISH